MFIDRYKSVLEDVEEQNQTQRSLNSQLLTLAAFANKLGMYDAADFLKQTVKNTKDNGKV